MESWCPGKESEFLSVRKHGAFTDTLGHSEDSHVGPWSSIIHWGPIFFPPCTPYSGDLGPSPGSRCAVGARLPWGRNEASTRAHIPELKTDEPQARDQRGAQAWGLVRETVTPRLVRASSEYAPCQRRQWDHSLRFPFLLSRVFNSLTSSHRPISLTRLPFSLPRTFRDPTTTLSLAYHESPIAICL